MSLPGAVPGPISSWADLYPGLDVTFTLTGPAGGTDATRGVITAVDAYTATLTSGDTIGATPTAGTTLTMTLNAAAPPAPATEPDVGACATDETGALWQRIGLASTSTWACIDGTTSSWAALSAAHTVTMLTVVAPTPLGGPGSGYPATITPATARIGMDVRVTITRATGGPRVIRDIIAWNQDNAVDPDWLRFGMAGGQVIQYNPYDDGVTALTVEQMNAWTDQGQGVGVAEPAVGTVLLSYTGVAWQCVGTATTDGPIDDQGQGPWYTTGQKVWRPVTGDDTRARAWLWFWGAAAPYKEMA